VPVLLAGLSIDGEKSAVDDRSDLPIAPRQLELDVPNGAVALELRHFPGSYLGPHEVAGAGTPQFLQRFDAEHFEERRIGVDDLPVQSRDVDSFLQTQRKLAERLGIAQISNTLLFFGLSGGLGTTHINASANGISVALMEG
jgi:hypothetical protein